jgi:phosphatidate phosphatase APP1
MSSTVPILLSFYALSNGTQTLLMGQLSYSSLKDFSFQSYSTRKTFRTILALYRTRFFAHQQVTLHFNVGVTVVTTDASGSFYTIVPYDHSQKQLMQIVLGDGRNVRIVEDLYHRQIHVIESPVIVVSDIDDTLLHSHISNKLLKLRTLMFTSMEKRKSVKSMTQLVRDLHDTGAASFYLSNSEQNLYPLIYRFLLHNGFPPGPLFLKQMRKVRDVFRSVTVEEREKHKVRMLSEIITLFPGKKYFLLGDNTQSDLKIYSAFAEKYPDNIRYIIIRKVSGRTHTESFLAETKQRLQQKGIGFYYADTFPETFQL